MSKEHPIRIQRSRQHKQVSPNGLPIIYVGRPTKWGNPVIVGTEFKIPYMRGHKLDYFPAEISHAHAVDLFEVKLKNNELPYTKENIIKELRGKNLSCWCKIGEPCHADILLKIANQ